MIPTNIELKNIIIKDDIITIFSSSWEKICSDSVQIYTLRFYDILTPLIGKNYLEVILSHPSIDHPFILKAKETEPTFDKLKDFCKYLKKHATVDIVKRRSQLLKSKNTWNKGYIFILIIFGIIIGSFINSKNSTGNVKSGTYDINGESFYFSDSVRNDVTGRWRISTTTSSQDVTQYAIDYYNTLFSSDDEIHAIVNFTLNTTTSISILVNGTLHVAIHEYVDGEEHDAKELFNGMLLGEYSINIETGQIEKIQ